MTVWGQGIAAGSAAGGTVLVNSGGADVLMQAPRGATIDPGDLVTYLQAGSIWYVLARYGTAAVADQPDNMTPPPAYPTSVAGTRVITPASTGTYRSGWRPDDTVEQGNYNALGNNTGAAFYSSGPRALAGATVDAARVRVRRLPGGPSGAQPITLQLITEADRPAGAPTLADDTAGPSLTVGETATITLPTGWGQDIVDGTAGGLGVFDADGSPYVVLAGLAAYTGAWSLSIDYTRTI